MSLLSRLGLQRIPNVEVVQRDADDEYRADKVGTIEIPDKLSDDNAFTLANTLTEIYWPIDFIADRASKLRYFIAKNFKEVKTSGLNRLLTDEMNPFFSFQDLVYQAIFSYLSDGNILAYPSAPSLYKTLSAQTITRLDILQPDMVQIREYNNINLLDCVSLNDLIKQAKYHGLSIYSKELIPENLTIVNIDPTRRDGSLILSKSPLFKAIRPINNLLATYSARYNVYVNNGAAGYLVRKNTTANGSIAEIANPADRDTILAEINNRQGLTGRRNLWGISSVPLEYINTLIDIQKLMPFDETLEDSIKIAAIYQLPAGIIPRKDKSTFDNQEVDDRMVWENAIMSCVQVVCHAFAKALRIDKAGYEIGVDYSTVSVLKENETSRQDLLTKKLDNIQKIKNLNPDADVSGLVQQIMTEYGKE